MIYRIKPYSGDGPYIFFSYSHADRDRVGPIIETMTKAGYQIWYDEGIHPGGNWPNVIARRLADACICIAAVSIAFVNSPNCLNELTFAIDNKKTIISLKLDDFVMPPGVRLQLANVHIINVFDYSEPDFYEKLYTGERLGECRDPASAEKIIPAEKIPEIQNKADRIKTIIPQKERKTTVSGNTPVKISEPDKNIILPVLVCLNSDRIFTGCFPVTKIGRSKKECDIYFESRNTISSHHADIIIRNGRNFLYDNHSANHTYISGKMIETDVLVEIQDYSEISLSRNERFFVAFDRYAEWIMKKMCLINLCSAETKERKYLFGSETVLGRFYPWQTNAMTDRAISRKHAVISINGTECTITDISKGGTYLNDKKIDVNVPLRLNDGDRLRFGNENFIFNKTILKKGVCLPV